MIEECTDNIYNSAKDLIAQGKYKQALEQLSAVSDNEDSRDLINECKYFLGKNAFEEGAFNIAINYLTDLDYPDAPELLETVKREQSKQIREKEEQEKEQHMRESGDYDFLDAVKNSALERANSSEDADNKTLVNAELSNLTDYRNKEFYSSNLRSLSAEYFDSLDSQRESFSGVYDSSKQIKWYEGRIKQLENLIKFDNLYEIFADNPEIKEYYSNELKTAKEILKEIKEVDQCLRSQFFGYMVFDTYGNQMYVPVWNGTEYNNFELKFYIPFIDSTGKVVETTELVRNNMEPYATVTLKPSIPGNAVSFNEFYWIINPHIESED